MNTELIPYRTVTEIVSLYTKACKQITEGYGLLEDASQSLKTVFEDKYTFDLKPKHYDWNEPEKTIDTLKADIWRAIINKMELKRLMSVERADKLDKALWDGKMPDGEPLPDITEKTVMDMVRSFTSNVDDYLKDAVKEVFDFLRPRSWWKEYKSNKKFEVGKRVILEHWLDDTFNGWYRVNHYRTNQMRALDNVFRLLDGKGPIKTYYGELHDAIESGKCETEYFSCKCHKNLNLHLEFKRPDLLAKLNKIAGGLNLGEHE
jgi:hypothetical protein